MLPRALDLFPANRTFDAAVLDSTFQIGVVVFDANDILAVIVASPCMVGARSCSSGPPTPASPSAPRPNAPDRAGLLGRAGQAAADPGVGDRRRCSSFVAVFFTAGVTSLSPGLRASRCSCCCSSLAALVMGACRTL